ncbi:DUF1302 family protein [Seongchinamella sediminis]|uniref:DUF1302 family protein n=1 Tax=Seongchinamella sediminis TaxID=2283635 RepID=A0A3L7DVM3_9GAMM|nr:DUF1302 family protein [Seongchinamella sediminis]RLQ21354.1 DUF1302 family protein [Seongchinamella sediminis]
MKLNTQQHKLVVALRGAALAGTVAVCAPAQALQFEQGDWLFNVDTTMGYSAQWRTESRDKDLESVLNDNDGNNSFDAGSMTSSKASFILELGGSYEDFSFFVRTDGHYDYVYTDGTSDMSRDNYLSFNSGIPVGGSVVRGEFARGTIEEHGRRIRLLDAFVTYAFDVGDTMGGAIRAGHQVISWGEATFYPGVNAIQNPIDSAVALAPGVEAKTVFLPTPAIDLKWDFNFNLSAEVYYKEGWDGSTLPGVGSYLSSSDITGPGAENLIFFPGVPANGKVGGKEKPGDSDGQYGVALRYITDNGTNFDFYYTESHSNIPNARVDINLSRFQALVNETYAEDVKIWGASFSTNVSEAQVYADVAYSENMPFVDLTPTTYIDDNGDVHFVQSDTTRGHYYQVIAGFTDLYTAFDWLSEQITLLGEVIYQGNNLGEGSLSEDAAGARNGVLVTDDAWGYQFRLSLKYFQVIRGMDVDVPITFKHDVDGYGNGIALNNGLKEGVKTASFGVTANYLSNWTFDARYNWYFGNDDPADKVLSDRDNFALDIKYRF